MTYNAAKITQNTIKLMEKYKKSFENDSSDAIKSCFEIAEYGCRIEISTFECNFIVAFIFKQCICWLFFFAKVHLA